MTEEHDLGAGLLARTAPHTRTCPARLDIVFPGGSSGLRFERTPDRTLARLAYGGWRAVPDVSAQPGAIVRQLHLSAREHAVDPNRWQHLVLGALRTWHGSLDWCQHLLAGIGAITHPLLGQVYERGHAPASELPRWGAAVLRQRTATEAARALCHEPTRRVTRSLAASLVSRPMHEPIDFTPLGWAVAAADLVDPDVLATLLDVRRDPAQHSVDPLPTGARHTCDTPASTPADIRDTGSMRGLDTGADTGAVSGAPSPMPSVDEVNAIRQGIRHWPAERRGALLLDAARHHGMPELVTALTHLCWVRDRIDQALPVRVDDLRALCRRHVPVLAPAGSHGTGGTRTTHTTGAAPDATAPDGGAGATAAPARRRARRTTAHDHDAHTTENGHGAGPDADRQRLAGHRTEPTAGRDTEPVTRTGTDPVTGTDASTGAGATRTRRPALLPAQPLAAPRQYGFGIAAGTPLSEVRWPVPAPLLTVHGHRRNGITFDVATTALELRTWGQQLRNCLGSFADAAHSGSSWLIGLVRDDVLIGCVEVHPHQRRVVQATGVANRALPLWVQRTVVDTLHDHRVTRPH